MTRKLIIAALVGTAALALGTAMYFTLGGLKENAPGRALWTKMKAPTRLAWIARVDSLPGESAGLGNHFSDPFGVVIDGHGNVFVADGGANNRIHRIGSDGLVATLAGGNTGFADG